MKRLHRRKKTLLRRDDFDHVTSFIEQEIAKMTAKNPGLEKKLDMAKTRKMPDISLPEDLDSEEDDSKLKETKHIKELTSEQKAIFSYFIPVKGMEDQICKAYNAVLDHSTGKKTHPQATSLYRESRVAERQCLLQAL